MQIDIELKNFLLNNAQQSIYKEKLVLNAACSC